MGLFKKLGEANDRAKANMAAKQQQRVDTKLVASFGSRGDKLLDNNLEPNEQILAKVKGDFGQGFVVTDKHVFIVKWGFMTGSTLGGKCVSYAYPNITGVHISKQAVKAMVQVLTPATQANIKLSYWGKRGTGNDAAESDYAVTFGSADMPVFQQAVQLAREHMGNTSQTTDRQPDTIHQLEQLAQLKDKGVLTEQEFAAKKKQLLGL